MTKRGYLLFVAKSMRDGEDPENRRFGELLLEVFPEDERLIPIALIKDIKQTISWGIGNEAIEIEGWDAAGWSQKKALAWIAGTPYVDDPRPGWTKRDLAMFARGYAVGRAIQKGNDNESARIALNALERIEREQSAPVARIDETAPRIDAVTD